MEKKIFIHGENGFCRNFPLEAKKRGLAYQVGNALEEALLPPATPPDVVLWNLNHENPVDMEDGRAFLHVLEISGVSVFPNQATCWHFEDKAVQQMLLAGVGAPMPEYWIFHDRKRALTFLESCNYPVVFKLKKGAGSINVKLVRNLADGRKLVYRMFGRGMRQHPPIQGIKRGVTRSKQESAEKDPFLVRARRAARLWFVKTLQAKREQGYIYFQEFIPNQTHDTRVTVIGDRAFVFERGVRDNDFRASGSGKLRYLSREEIPLDMVDLALRLSRQLGFQSMAYDFVRRSDTGEPVILEICYTFKPSAVAACPGYMTAAHEWVEGNFRPEQFIFADLVADA